jgi:hypothetical protein
MGGDKAILVLKYRNTNTVHESTFLFYNENKMEEKKFKYLKLKRIYENETIQLEF